MKSVKLNIINSQGNLVSFDAIQPETNEEIMAGLGNYSQAEAMICFPVSPEVCLQPYLFNNHADNVDTLYIDWMGNIKPKSYPDTVCRIELKLGLCKKHNINPGDSIFHDRFHILSDNTINIKGYKFEKVTLDILKSIKPEDILIIENSNSGSKDMIRQSAILITKKNKFYYIDYSTPEHQNVFNKIISKTSLFELYSNADSCLLINNSTLPNTQKKSILKLFNHCATIPKKKGIIMKKISFISLLTIIYPNLVLGYSYTITDNDIRNHSYSVEQVDSSDYATLPQQQRFSYVNQTGNTEYYQINMPDLSVYDSESYISTRQTPTGGTVAYNIHNSVATNGDSGGAICGYADTIIGNFVNNSVIRTDSSASGFTYGGAIYVTGDINLISGNFINNYMANNNADNFYKFGSAIYNPEHDIQTISGTFVGNHGALSAVDNRGNIENIEADFIANYADEWVGYGAEGIALDNAGYIGDLTGDFIGNYFTGNANHRTILTNYQNGTINSLTGSFIGNKASSLGIINNSGTINLNANGKDIIFSNPLASGAIYNSGTINMGGTNGQNIIFSTTHDGIANAGTINLNSGTIIFNAGIHSTGTVYNAQTQAYETPIGNINVSGADVYFSDSVGLTEQVLAINSGSVSIFANKLPSNVTNNSLLKLTGGTLSQAISGTGCIVINGNVVSNVNITQNTIINEGKALTVSANYIHSSNLTNNGLLKLSNGTLNENISLYGNTEISGTVYSNANNLNVATTNNGTLRITGGTIGQSITGTGSIIIDGTVNSDVSLNQSTMINSSKALTIYANNINTNYFSNYGTLIVTGGTLSKSISGNGTTIISENTVSDAAISQNTTINAGKTLTVSASNISANKLINNGSLLFNGGVLSENISGFGNVQNIGTLSSNANYLDVDFVNNNKLNLTGGTLSKNITGNGTVRITDLSLGTNNIHIQNSSTVIDGVLQLNIEHLSEGSSVYTGGHLDVIGNLNINPNSELRLVIAPSLLKKHQSTGELNLISVSGTRNGDFDILTANNMYTISKSGDAYIISQGKSIRDIIQDIDENNQNFINAGNAWNNAIFGSYSSQDNIQYLLSYLAQYDAEGYVESLDNLVPTEANVAGASFRNINTGIIKQFSERFNALKAVGRSGGDSVQTKFNVWAQALFNKSEQTGQTKFDTNASGVTFGAESMFDDKFMLGLGYTYGKTTTKSGAKTLDGNNSIFSIYAEYDMDNLYLNGGISYGIASYEQSTKYQNTAKFNTNTYSLNAAVGYNIGKYTPEIRAIYINTSVDKYKDAAGQEIQYDDNSVLSLVPSVKYVDSFSAKSAKVTPEIGLGIVYDIISEDSVAKVDLGSAQYSVYGEKINPFGINFNIGTGLTVSDWNFSAVYDLELRNNFISHTGRIKAKYMF